MGHSSSRRTVLSIRPLLPAPMVHSIALIMEATVTVSEVGMLQAPMGSLPLLIIHGS